MADTTTAVATEVIHADHQRGNKLGNWTTARQFTVKSRWGFVELDFRSPQIPDGTIDLHIDLDHAVLKLLLAEDASIDSFDLDWTGRGRVKDWEPPKTMGGRRVRITGKLHDCNIRVHRGGMAILSAMVSRDYIEDLWAANREGRMPTVDDPARTGQPA